MHSNEIIIFTTFSEKKQYFLHWNEVKPSHMRQGDMSRSSIYVMKVNAAKLHYLLLFMLLEEVVRNCLYTFTSERNHRLFKVSFKEPKTQKLYGVEIRTVSALFWSGIIPFNVSRNVPDVLPYLHDVISAMFRSTVP